MVQYHIPEDLHLLCASDLEREKTRLQTLGVNTPGGEKYLTEIQQVLGEIARRAEGKWCKECGYVDPAGEQGQACPNCS